jgi:glycosyltransferase involved in cell wall biosynthesis
MKQNLKVSVCMITYDHEKFIREAIEGVLMQECNFEVELILSNDCSLDKTDKVIRDVLENHPRKSRIKYFKHDKNLGMMPNFIFAMQQCQGVYVALCEGDDYWVDPLKLQKQVDFLQANPEYVIHSGAAQLLNNGIVTNELIGFENESRTFNITDFYKQNNLITCTVMFKNCLSFFPEVFKNVIFGDWFLYTLLLQKTDSKAYRSNEILSVYRVHSSSVMSSLTLVRNYQAHLYQIMEIKKNIGYPIYPLNVIHSVNMYSIKKFRLEINNYQFLTAFKTFFQNFYISKLDTPIKQYLSSFVNSILKKCIIL